MLLKFLNHIGNLVLYGCFLTVTFIAVSSVVEAKDYRGIRPLKTTRAEVEQKFGKPDKNGNYQIDGELFQVDYIAEYNYGQGCENKDNCECLVGPDIVIQIEVNIHYELKLKQLKLKLNRYEKTLSTHLTRYVTYSNYDEGIVYLVWKEDKNEDRVTKMTFLPSSKDCESILKNKK